MSSPPLDPAFVRLTMKIATERGFVCANYKDSCLRRRIAVRMRACGVADYTEYAQRLDSDREEYDRLLDALTINVTKLFRNVEVWTEVERSVMPALLALQLPRVTIWSAGCSSGEELYTLAAIAHRVATRSSLLARLSRLRILGTDIDRGSLEAARRGAYAEEAFSEVPSEIRQRYFSAGWPAVATPELRALIDVERRDMLSEPAPSGPLQMITCRNVVIYFDRAGQEALFRKFHDALAPGGYLILGKVETLIGPVRSLFEAVDQRQRIFRRPAAA